MLDFTTMKDSKKLTEGARALRSYLDKRGLSLTAFCAKHGLDRVQVSRSMRLLVGQTAKRVSVDFAYQIQRATAGKVRCEMWRSETATSGSVAA
jgi:hypothetical protein